MIEFKLKKEVTIEMLKEVGFDINAVEDPKTLSTRVFAYRNNVVIEVSSEERIVEWRYAGFEDKSIASEIFDIMVFIDVPKYEMSGELNFHVPTSLNDWCYEVHRNAREHGWWEEKKGLPEIIALIHSELSEALEEFRNNKPMYYEEDGKPEGIATELVDAVIRIMDYFGSQEVDLESILIKKHAYNLTRPYKHGGKKI